MSNLYYLLKKKSELENILENTTNDKKYYSAESSLSFINKELLKYE